MNKTIQIAMVYYAACQLELELNDELKATHLYRQKLKNLLKNIQSENEKSIATLYKEMNAETQQQFGKIVGMVETFVSVVKNKDLDLFTSLLKDFEAGKIGVLEEGKHTKIFKQLPKL